MAKHIARIDQLSPHPDNARQHDKKHVDQVVKSVCEFGWAATITVDEDLTIIAGHGRWMAAKEIRERGFEIPNWPDTSKVPIHQVLGLTPEQKRAYLLADNKLTLLGDWDDEKLAAELANLKEFDPDLLNVTGFTEKDLVKLLGGGQPASQSPDDDAMHVVTVECASEEEQRDVYEELTGRGIKCRIQSL